MGLGLAQTKPHARTRSSSSDQARDWFRHTRDLVRELISSPGACDPGFGMPWQKSSLDRARPRSASRGQARKFPDHVLANPRPGPRARSTRGSLERVSRSDSVQSLFFNRHGLIWLRLEPFVLKFVPHGIMGRQLSSWWAASVMVFLWVGSYPHGCRWSRSETGHRRQCTLPTKGGGAWWACEYQKHCAAGGTIG